MAKSKEFRSKFDLFLGKARKYINEDIGVIVDNKHHGEVTNLAKAILVQDLHEQVVNQCPTGMTIPRGESLWLQFWPKMP